MTEENPDRRPVELSMSDGAAQDCVSCGSPFATAWSTTDGTAWLCRECANLHGLGCP